MNVARCNLADVFVLRNVKISDWFPNMGKLLCPVFFQTMVYEKALCLSTVATTGGKMNMGQITNHMSVDPNAVMFMFLFVNNLWAIPIQVRWKWSYRHRHHELTLFCSLVSVRKTRVFNPVGFTK